jgi:hypothetical protein
LPEDVDKTAKVKAATKGFLSFCSLPFTVNYDDLKKIPKFVALPFPAKCYSISSK